MIGIDEVGRGCWAGPLLVVAARAISDLPSGLTDSKLLTKKQRESIFEPLLPCAQFGEGWVEAIELDALGLGAALKLGTKRALYDLKASVNEEIVLDGSVNYIDPVYKKSRCEIKADFNIPIVSAASIYAKVMRDNFMNELSLKHPDYSFEKHLGYGTKIHSQALQKYGIIKGVHRVSFKPVRALI
jgi:ribonuclease HII